MYIFRHYIFMIYLYTFTHRTQNTHTHSSSLQHYDLQEDSPKDVEDVKDIFRSLAALFQWNAIFSNPLRTHSPRLFEKRLGCHRPISQQKSRGGPEHFLQALSFRPFADGQLGDCFAVARGTFAGALGAARHGGSLAKGKNGYS